MQTEDEMSQGKTADTVCVQMTRAQGNDNTHSHERAQHINKFNRLFYLCVWLWF